MPDQRVPQHVHPVLLGEIDEPVGALPFPVDAVGPDHAPLHRVLAGDGIELARDQVQLRRQLLVKCLVADSDPDAKIPAKGMRQSRGLLRPGHGLVFRQCNAGSDAGDVAEQGTSGWRRW